MSVCVFFPFILDVRLWTYQPESHRRKITQDFSSTFLLRCLPFISLARRIQPFLSLVDRELTTILIVSTFLLVYLLDFFFFFPFSEEKSQLTGFEFTSQRVRRFRGYQLNHRSGRLSVDNTQKTVVTYRVAVGQRNKKPTHVKRETGKNSASGYRSTVNPVT